MDKTVEKPAHLEIGKIKVHYNLPSLFSLIRYSLMDCIF